MFPNDKHVLGAKQRQIHFWGLPADSGLVLSGSLWVGIWPIRLQAWIGSALLECCLLCFVARLLGDAWCFFSGGQDGWLIARVLAGGNNRKHRQHSSREISGIPPMPPQCTTNPRWLLLTCGSKKKWVPCRSRVHLLFHKLTWKCTKPLSKDETTSFYRPLVHLRQDKHGHGS